MCLPWSIPVLQRVKLVLFFAAIAGFAAFASAQNTRPGCVAAHYKVVPLPFPPTRINNSGVVVGTTEEHLPATWSQKDGLHKIELPAGSTAVGFPAINRTGDVVGTLKREGSERPFAFKYSGGKLMLLSDDPSKAEVVGDSGDAAGINALQLALWHQGKVISLGGCCGGTIRGINQHGQIVGQLNDKEGHYSAFLWEDNKMHSIAPPTGTMSTAIAINDQGHVLMRIFTPNEVFLWRGGKLTTIQLSAEMASQPLGLSNCDVIVGEFGASSDYYHAFIWDEKNGMHDLNTLIDANSGWTLEQALDINDRGEIIGTGDHGNEEDTGFLLVPEH
jgi:probable HAF family extracellular repeat protein